MAIPTSIETATTSKSSLNTFDLLDLQGFTSEGVYARGASADVKLFYAGRDRIHEALCYVLSRVRTSLFLSMFGYDNEELNDIIMEKIEDPSITVLVTLDSSQAGGVHEKRILESNAAKNPSGYSSHFVIGQSSTHRINHSKAFVADGRVCGEGSTNWSKDGEGVGIPGAIGYHAQNNTQSFITDPDTISRLTSQLIAEHMAARHLVKK